VAPNTLPGRLADLRAGRRARKQSSVYLSEAAGVVALASDFAMLSDSDLDARAGELMDARHQDTDRAHSFAVLREVAARTTGLTPYPTQIAAGLALLDAHMVQMETGEGKTLAAVIPAALLARRLGHCHILTFNDYLAHRDAEWMRPFYARLGMSVGVVQSTSSPSERRAAYQCDITYATAKEVGFDVLRDGLVFDPGETVLQPLAACIVDEADSILIDEARIPLVIAGARHHSDVAPTRIAELVRGLDKNLHYFLDDDELNANLTEEGLTNIERQLGGVRLHDDEHYLLLTEVNQALHARVLLIKDVDYLVRGDGIDLVDQFTGRVVSDRRWPDGLQAAVEAKEGLPIQPGGRILGSITLPDFLSAYDTRAGMTATALPAAVEFEHAYGLAVIPIPPNRPCVRTDRPDRIFRSLPDKEAALMEEIGKLHAKGRPVLVGTYSVAESERLGAGLAAHGIDCQILNARNDQDEAAIVAEAGALGAVTVSTNMAGRGTDIKLGGANTADRDWAVRLGGLHVIGTNRHESQRIDNQLRGRAGRQGDPGSSQLFVSLEDPIMTRNGIEELLPARLLTGPSFGDDPHPLIVKEVNRVQRIATGRNREIRSTTTKYTDMIDQQRRIVAEWRLQILAGDLPELPDSPTAGPVIAGPDHLRRLFLDALDERWTDHLALASDIRDGVHLVRLGGLDPLYEFQKQVAGAFVGFQEEVVETVAARAPTAHLAKPPGPAATWTYLINDRVGNDLQTMLFGSGNEAFSAGAALMTWPLLLYWGISRRLKARSD
jgi:preprotein translocase subunit SecA